MWRRIVNVLMVLMLMAGSMVALSGCKKEEAPGPAEKAGQKVDKATKEAGKAMEEAGKELQKSTE